MKMKQTLGKNKKAPISIFPFSKGRLIVNQMHRAKGKGYLKMDTPCSQPSYSNTYHSPEGLIHLRTS